MKYKIVFAKKAVKQFKALPSQEQRKLKTKIDNLEFDPRPSGVVKFVVFKM